MSDENLILYPKDPNAEVVDAATLERELAAAGFIGREIDVVGERRFRPGPRFEKLLPFSSSHEVIVLNPEAKEEERGASPSYCTIEIPELLPQIEFLGGANVEDPLCPHCGFQFADWSDSVETWFDDRSAFETTCPGCQAREPLWQLDWKKTNGFGRSRIVVWGVRLGEAVPAAELLEVLKGTSEAAWDYFYSVL